MALVTRYVNRDVVGGNDDGTSEANAWTYLYQATGAIKTDAGTNNFHVWVKGGGTAYTASDDADHDGNGGAAGSVIYMDQASAAAAPNVFEGYKTTIGDDGIAELDADANSLTHCIHCYSNYTVFKNFELWGASDDGFNGASGDYLVLKNISSHNQGAAGIQVDDSCVIFNCISYTNSAIGIDADVYSRVICSVAHGCTYGIYIHYGEVISCLAWGTSDAAIQINDATSGQLRGTVIGCTVDGDGDDLGIVFGAGTAPHGSVCINSILYDTTTPISVTTASNDLECMISGWCLYEINDNANSNWPAISEGDGIGDGGDNDDPANTFSTEPPTTNLHYYPHASSGALGRAIDAYFCINFWNDYNEGGGDNPPSE